VLGPVFDGDEINKRMRFVRRQAHASVVIGEFIETGRETRERVRTA
jgi:hypothetical protein